ncbi:UNVERIFIED_ORG: hypothetical protein ABIC62_002596 [Burkholderia sp. 1595]
MYMAYYIRLRRYCKYTCVHGGAQCKHRLNRSRIIH